jgi:hypothetical protein
MFIFNVLYDSLTYMLLGAISRIVRQLICLVHMLLDLVEWCIQDQIRKLTRFTIMKLVHMLLISQADF